MDCEAEKGFFSEIKKRRSDVLTVISLQTFASLRHVWFLYKGCAFEEVLRMLDWKWFIGRTQFVSYERPKTLMKPFPGGMP